MCGIAAIFNYRESSPIDRAEMQRVLDRMKRRGPDGSGEWYSPNQSVSLGHRRLSIIDLSDAGAQPMHSADGKTIITFNGEIYNYQALRKDLQATGRVFRSNSDTEVLLQLYEQHGLGMLQKLRGMYAFAIWDANKGGLFLARDPFGIKPLYYSDDGKTFRAASQVKALLAGGHIDTNPAPAGHVGFFLWGHVPEPYTLYKGIRALPAGSSVWIDQDGPSKIKTFCNITEILASAESSHRSPTSGTLSSPKGGEGRGEEAFFGNPSADLRSALLDTVRHHLIADVPVGVFLSAGLDSTTLAALATECGGNIKTVTLGFEEFKGTQNDETFLAALVAKRYGTDHQTIWVTKADFQNSFDRLLDAMDQPSNDGVNSFFISRAASEAGLKVALSGLGGDEIFGGYPSFKQIPSLVRRAKPFQKFGRAFRVLSAPILKRLTSPKYAGVFEYGGNYSGAYLLRRGMFMPWELPEILDPELVREGWNQLRPLASLDATADVLESPHSKVTALEMSYYMRNQLLRDTDWASMDHSLEIRTPFLDLELIREIAPMITPAPHIDKQAMAASPRKTLPKAILHRPKTGFLVPVHDWLLQTSDSVAHDRGLRGWTKTVYNRSAGSHFDLRGKSSAALSRPKSADRGKDRFLMLLSDGFGGHGGIAKFNRDFLSALCSYPSTDRVYALPRLMPQSPGKVPQKLVHVSDAVGGKTRFLGITGKTAWTLRASEPRHWPKQAGRVIFCAHINLLPAAFIAKRIWGAPVVLIIHGIDAWQPTNSRVVNRLVRKIDYFISVSDVTKQRFLRWANLAADKGLILPNCVDLSAFSPGAKDPVLVSRYKFEGRTVIMTLGRLAAAERYKGFDEVLEILPSLSKRIPNISYLIVGDGLDRSRLQAKAAELGVTERVVFAGRISEEEKAAHYRLADAYVMPSSGEGFGIVHLEAMACGIPVVGSKADGSREALRGGELGILVDPQNAAEIEAGIVDALKKGQKRDLLIPTCSEQGLDYFSSTRFEQRLQHILDQVDLTGVRSR